MILNYIVQYNCFALCGSSACQLCFGANGNLLQEGLGSRPSLPGLLQPEPMSLRQPAADSRLQWRHPSPQRQVWLSLLGITVFCCACSVCALQVSLEGMRFDSKCDFAPPTVLLGFSFALGCRVSILVRSNILLLMVVHLLIATLDLSQMSTCPSTLPSH